MKKRKEFELTFNIANKIITEFIILLNAKNDFKLSVSYKIDGRTKILTITTNTSRKRFKNNKSENNPRSKFEKKRKIVK